MLILLAGATGSLGSWLIDSFLNRGHQVRVLGRNPSKLNSEKLQKLESFVQSKTYYDIEALDKACTGVDGVVCAYNAMPELQLDGQLLLLRAAERAGVKRFVACTWNGDWRGMNLAEQDSYNGILSFHSHVEMTSDIKPHYIFCGVLGEVLFASKATMDFSAKHHGPWDPEAKAFEIWGTGDEPWQWTSEKDAAEFAAAIILRDDAEEGGYWTVCSGSESLKEMAAVYEKVKGTSVELRFLGPLDKLGEIARDARAKSSPKYLWEYIGYFYYFHIATGRWLMKDLDNDKLKVKATPLAQFLQESPDI